MSEPKVNVELGASARLEIKAEVPAASTGRLVDALTDLIRPLTEARGLRGDVIRLQREEVALEIARRALERKAIESSAIVPVANKVLVPLLEKCSLEDVSDETMMERWAELLASAATEDSIPPRFVALLSEINGTQARALEEMYFVRESNIDGMGTPIIDKPLDGIGYDIDYSELKKLVRAATTATSTPFDTFLATIQFAMSGPGLQVGTIHLASEDSDPNRAAKLPRSDPSNTQDLNVLQSLSLLEQKRFDDEFGTYALTVVYYQVTDLGVGLLEACSPRVRMDVAARTQADGRRGPRKSRRG
ncbi:MAG TPA: Abi-alpha family protein [Terricaulis sp.]|nr:Abi-alpha family protein [Terricaulis sp.]